MSNWWWLVIVPSSILALIALGKIVWAVASWHGSINTDRENFKEFMKEIREKIIQIFERLPERAVSSRSPMSLTKLGEEIAEELAAKAWARSLSDGLLPKVAGMRAFEVDEFADDYVQNNLTPEWDIRARESAYRHGLRRNNILNVLRVVLRDELLRTENFPGPEDRPSPE